MFNFDDILKNFEDEAALDTFETEDDLKVKNKEYLVRKILKLQEKLTSNKDLSKSISDAIADGFDKAIRGNTSTITTSGNANIRLATADDFKSV